MDQCGRYNCFGTLSVNWEFWTGEEDLKLRRTRKKMKTLSYLLWGDHKRCVGSTLARIHIQSGPCEHVLCVDGEQGWLHILQEK